LQFLKTFKSNWISFFLNKANSNTENSKIMKKIDKTAEN